MYKINKSGKKVADLFSNIYYIETLTGVNREAHTEC